MAESSASPTAVAAAALDREAALETSATTTNLSHTALELEVADFATEIAHLVLVGTISFRMCRGAAGVARRLHGAAGGQMSRLETIVTHL